MPESWSFYTGDVPHEQYMKQLDGFTASHYDPRAWAELFARVGAHYAVLTARHHDGVALWDTGHGDLNVVRDTPAGRDLVTGFVDALREQNLKVGLYYSHSDWNHPDYAERAPPRPGRRRAQRLLLRPPAARRTRRPGQRYLAYRDGQVGELVDRFRPDLLWFDGEWERTEEQWQMRELSELILAGNPDTVLNARMLSYGDYATPEQGVPLDRPGRPVGAVPDGQRLVGLPARGPQPQVGPPAGALLHRDHRHGRQPAARRRARMEDGTIPAEQVERLEGLGAWIAKHAERRVRHGRGAARRAPLRAEHPLRRPAHPLPDLLRHAPRGRIGIRGLRNAGHGASRSSARAPSWATASPAAWTRCRA